MLSVPSAYNVYTRPGESRNPEILSRICLERPIAWIRRSGAYGARTQFSDFGKLRDFRSNLQESAR
jgi:hypothetical protein